MKTLEITLKEQGKIKRLTNKTFQFPKEIENGFYSANYFLKTRKIVAKHLKNHQVTMQFFQRTDDAMVCGIDLESRKLKAIDIGTVFPVLSMMLEN